MSVPGADKVRVTLTHERGLFGKIKGEGRNGEAVFTPISGGSQ